MQTWAPRFFSCKIRTTVLAGRMPGTAVLSPGQSPLHQAWREKAHSRGQSLGRSLKLMGEELSMHESQHLLRSEGSLVRSEVSRCSHVARGRPGPPTPALPGPTWPRLAGAPVGTMASVWQETHFATDLEALRQNIRCHGEAKESQRPYE